VRSPDGRARVPTRSEVGASLANGGSVEERPRRGLPVLPDYGAGGACDTGEAESHADEASPKVDGGKAPNRHRSTATSARSPDLHCIAGGEPNKPCTLLRSKIGFKRW